MNKLPPLPTPGITIEPAALLRSYSQREFAEVTGYCVRMLSRLKAEGNPAWKNGKWHVYPWLLWLSGELPNKKKAGRPRSL